jgi:sugar O-acyltransferase (sialic acid O-acetyltransferase NeuD family)
MLRDLVIYGAGGFGTEALEIAEAINADTLQWNILGFIDDDSIKHGTGICGYPVFGGREWLRNNLADVIICIGSPRLRRKVSLDLHSEYRCRFPALLHPSAIVSKRAIVGAGSVVCPAATIAANTQIGNHVLVGRNASIGHDITIGDYANIFPSATISGHCRIGEGTEIGSNATTIPKMNINSWSVVGAGSVVIQDLPSNVTAVGSQARIIMRREDGWQNHV